MKKKVKFVLWGLALLLAGAAFAVDMEVFLYAETAKEKYADGSPVLPGEWYALVWLAEGETFQGFNADCTLVGADDEKNHFFKAQPLAPEWVDEDGMGMMQFNIDPGAYLSKGGTWNVYLLDTRKVTGVDEKGKPTYAVSEAVNQKAIPETVNAYGLEASGDAVALDDGFYNEEGSKAEIVSAAPAGAEAVKVAGIRPAGDTVYLTVTNTMACLWYNVTRGDSPANATAEKNVARQPKNGKADGGTIELEVPKGASDAMKFYRVIRQTVK